MKFVFRSQLWCSVSLLVVVLVSGQTLPAARSAAAPLGQDYSIIYHNPDSEYYVEGSGLVRTENGTLVAVVPVIPRGEWADARRVDHCTTHILTSRDGGRKWEEVSTLPYYSCVPWTRGSELYVFAMKGGVKLRNDDLLLLRSVDGGKTWSAPVTLFRGHYWNCHTGMVVRDQKLYWAVDDLSFGAKRGPVAVIGDLSGDPLRADAWRLSNPVPYPGTPELMIKSRLRKLGSQYLEPNVVDLYGKLRILATVKAARQSSASVCAILDLEDDGKEAQLTFNQFSSMPGGQLKFCVIWDPVSKLFWATANLVADSQGVMPWWTKAGEDKKFRGDGGLGGNDRRFLMLFYSVDVLNWFQAGCVAQAAKASQSFMYARPVVDGDDLAIISRSSIAAPNQHDADHATFHRVHGFRSLAMNLVPELETPSAHPQ